MQAVKRVSAGNLSIQVYIWGKPKWTSATIITVSFTMLQNTKALQGCGSTAEQSAKHYPDHEKLEKELGCTLFVRQRHGIALTPEGEKLYAHISVAFEHISYGEQEIARDKSLQSGIVTIAASEIASTVSFFPP